VPIDNNASERQFQRHAKLRFNALFAGSVEGGHRWATIAGVIATARSVGVDVHAYLIWALDRLGTHRKHFGLTAAELTPMAYASTLSDNDELAAAA
jgi:transposase